MKMKEVQQVTTCIKHLAVSALSSVSSRIKCSCNLIGNCFEMPNVSYTQPLQASLERGLWLSEQQELKEKQVLYQKLIIILYNKIFY